MLKKSLFMLAAVAMIGLVSCKPKASTPTPEPEDYAGEITPAKTTVYLEAGSSDVLDITVTVDGRDVVDPVISEADGTGYIVEVAITGTNSTNFSVPNADINEALFGVASISSVTQIPVMHTGASTADEATLTLTLHKYVPNTDPAVVAEKGPFSLTQMSEPVEVTLNSKEAGAPDPDNFAISADVEGTVTLDLNGIDTKTVTLTLTNNGTPVADLPEGFYYDVFVTTADKAFISIDDSTVNTDGTFTITADAVTTKNAVVKVNLKDADAMDVATGIVINVTVEDTTEEVATELVTVNTDTTDNAIDFAEDSTGVTITILGATDDINGEYLAANLTVTSVTILDSEEVEATTLEADFETTSGDVVITIIDGETVTADDVYTVIITVVTDDEAALEGKAEITLTVTATPSVVDTALVVTFNENTSALAILADGSDDVTLTITAEGDNTNSNLTSNVTGVTVAIYADTDTAKATDLAADFNVDTATVGTIVIEAIDGTTTAGDYVVVVSATDGTLSGTADDINLTVN